MRDDPIPRFVRVPAGEFSMGSDDGADDERPTHPVHVDAYYSSSIGIHQEMDYKGNVFQAEFAGTDVSRG